jgi:glycosyltransferase involved in cell wall biosynthesis
MSIPKILHQIWIGPKEAPTNLMKTWKEKHPDFEYILWNEHEIRNRLILRCHEKINMISEINGKADIIRWEILYQYGGYFVDADSICIEPFDAFFEGKTAFATYENENVRSGLIATGTMGFIPKHPLCSDIIQWILSNESDELIKETRAWFSVGPALLTKMLETGKYPDVSIYPSYCFLPIHFTGSASYEGHKKVYGYQEWGTAKQSYDTMNSVILPKELYEPAEWVSVLIASYNTNNTYVKECLDSIKCQNGYFGIELVWINDGSTDENTEVLEKLLHHFSKSTRFTRVVYKKNECNIGPAKSYNIGLSLCTNELVFRMDSDDIMLPNRIKIQLSFMNKNPNVVICGTNVRLFTQSGSGLESTKSTESNGKKIFVSETKHPHITTWKDLYENRYSWYMNHPTFCFRKSAISKIGNYRTNDDRILYFHDDYDLLARILKTYQIAYTLPDVLLLYRLHNNQLTYKLDTNSYENITLRNDIIEYAAKMV